jgi:galactokinase
MQTDAASGFARIAVAPGRVNLMGDHTDYNHGFALPAAIALSTRVGFAPAADGWLRLATDAEPEDGVVAIPAGGALEEPHPAWAVLAAAVAASLDRRGRPAGGMSARVSSDVPLGAGLSSSAAFEVAVTLALCDTAGWSVARTELAAACREAEEVATGVPCGPMDQLASLFGRRGHALLLDCRSLEIEPVAIPEDLSIVAIHTGVARRLAGSAYASRRDACARLARDLGVASLRDATPPQVRDSPIGRHVVSENARVLATVEALRRNDREALGALFAESHRSLAEDYEVSTPELDALVAEATSAGAIACRMTGAGFGGCVVALLDRSTAEDVLIRTAERYRKATGHEPVVYRCDPSAGADVNPA